MLLKSRILHAPLSGCISISRHCPLSQAIKEPEEELDVVLFACTTRSTRLTCTGTLFFERVRRVFFHEQLRVALSSGITPSRLPAMLALCRPWPIMNESAYRSRVAGPIQCKSGFLSLLWGS